MPRQGHLQSGIGFYLPHELKTSEVLIELPSSVHPPSVSVPATLVRANLPRMEPMRSCAFRLPGLRQNLSRQSER